MKRGKKNCRGIKGQVWIETVMYTLIAFAIMGLVLAYARPKIEALQDKAIIEQSILMLKDIDSTLLTMGGAGNQRVIEISIKKGDLKIDGVQDKIVFEIESMLEYSQPDKTISSGNVDILTKKSGKFNTITLTRDFFGDYDLTNTERDETRTISKSPVSYTLKISDKGTFTRVTAQTCPLGVSECSGMNPALYTPECTGTPTLLCQYTSKRPTIDFKLI
ncbi:MAG: hypothetical protein Q7S06_02375 [Nanoarchaeota archaeon]|nr:hypothetical protein [Nanoarchaeota archaeon]